MRKAKLIVCAVILTMVATTAGAFACTGVYVGKDASSDGTTIVARSEDQGSGAYNKMFKVQPRVTKAGRYFVDTGEDQNGFKVPLPTTTYKYTYVPDSSDAGDGMYPASCTNEYGVTVIGTVSTGVKEAYEKADPTVETGTGLREAILPGLIACQATSAKDGVNDLAKLVDEYGSEEWNTLFIADQKEAWIFEIYGGHTYCAMLLPADQVSVFGNQIMIGTVDQNDTANYVFSKDLFTTIDKAGAVKEDGKYNLAKSIDGSRSVYSNMRTWMGHKILAPSTAGEYVNDNFYPLCYKPDSKVSVLDVMDIYRNRYEGTPYDMSKPGNEGNRCIGVTRQSDVHIVQIYSNLPKDTADLEWLCMGNAEGSVFIPFFSGITATNKAYHVDGSAYNASSAYWTFKKNTALEMTDRAFLEQGVRDYWKIQEKLQYSQIQSELAKVQAAYKNGRTEGRSYVTALGNKMAAAQLSNANALYNDLFYTFTANLNDRANNLRKTTFVGNTKMTPAAKLMGYKVSSSTKTVDKQKVKTYTLTKGDKKVVFSMGTGVYSVTEGTAAAVEGTFTNLPYVSGGYVYVPVDFINSL